MAEGEAQAGGNPGAFGKRGALVLVAIGVLAFVAFLFLVGQGGLSGSANDGRAHAAGTGLNGFAGLTRLLEADGTPVVRSRNAAGLDDPGLLVLTPPVEADTEELAQIVDRRRTIGPTLVVAPKWFAVPASGRRSKPGWVHLMAAGEEWSLALDGRTLEIESRDNLNGAPRWRDSTLGSGLRGTLPSDRAANRFATDSADGLIAPLVTDGSGAVLAGYLADDGSYLDGDLFLDPERSDARPVYGVMLVAEPDLLNNWGLADRARAALAVELLAIARQGTLEPVRFDMTLNGLGGSRNLLTLAFEPPFLAATLALLLALAIAMWRAFARFGPALRPAPAIQPGKSQLVANGAQVITRSGRLRLLRTPYESLVRARIAARLGLRETDEAGIERALAARGSPGLAQTLRPLRNAASRSDLLRAARSLRDLERTL